MFVEERVWDLEGYSSTYAAIEHATQRGMFTLKTLPTVKRSSSITHVIRIHANENSKSWSIGRICQRVLIQSAFTSTASPACPILVEEKSRSGPKGFPLTSSRVIKESHFTSSEEFPKAPSMLVAAIATWLMVAHRWGATQGLVIVAVVGESVGQFCIIERG